MSNDEDNCGKHIKEDRSAVRRIVGHDETSRPKKVSSTNTNKEK